MRDPKTIDLHDGQTAPENSKSTLAAVHNMIGFTPNLFRAMANSPSTLNGFAALLQAHDQGTLSQAERQIVQLTASRENGCGYCVAGHSAFAESIGLPFDLITAIRDGRPLSNPRYRALADFTAVLVQNRGLVTKADLQAFLSAGFAQEQVFEVIAGIALKTISNFVNGAFDLTLDDAFRAHEWRAPETRPSQPV